MIAVLINTHCYSSLSYSMSPNYSTELPDVSGFCLLAKVAIYYISLILSWNRLKLDLKGNNLAHQVGSSFPCVVPFSLMEWEHPVLFCMLQELLHKKVFLAELIV